MSSKAFLCGINLYPGGNQLQGCVPDVTNAAKAMVTLGLFKQEEIRLLTDKRATTAAIMDRLQWLVEDLAAGDRILFWYSGHGCLMPTRSLRCGNVVSNDCAICPVDFDWSPEHAITTNDFATVFCEIPNGVLFQWVSDSCHSGDLTRDVNRLRCGTGYRKPRQFPMPDDIAWRAATAESIGLLPDGLSRAMPSHLNGAFIGGCKINQTSCDAFIDGEHCGALSHALLARLLHGFQVTPENELVETLVADLVAGGFDQTPQLRGSDERIVKGFLQE